MAEFISFTRNYEDNSTDAGYQFTFYCDLCKEGYKSRFIESSSYKKRGILRGLGGIASAAGQMAGKYNVGYGIDRSTDVLSERFQGQTPEWQKEHEKAFEAAQNEVRGRFHRCPKCRQWVCDNDWNEQEGLCVDDAPRVNVEVAAARGKKMAQDIQTKASATNVFSGEIESKQTLCPKCGKPSGEGKFCNSCGAPLGLKKCPKCGATNQAATRFCGECGTKI